MRRRTKQLLQRLATIAIIIAVAVAIVMFFKPKKTIETSDSNINRKEYVGTIQDSKPVNIVLPENIVSTEENPNVSTNSTKTSDVKYEPIVSSKETYFIPFQTTEKEFKLLIGYDSEPLLEGSPVESTKEYDVKGMPENIKSIFFFKLGDYKYPILLVLGQSGKLYYVDIETAYTTGSFTVNGPIKNLPAVKEVNSTTVTKDGKEYVGAVITCENGQGYEFDISMIGI
jgi:hypothetical protein